MALGVSRSQLLLVLLSAPLLAVGDPLVFNQWKVPEQVSFRAEDLQDFGHRVFLKGKQLKEILVTDILERDHDGPCGIEYATLVIHSNELEVSLYDEDPRWSLNSPRVAYGRDVGLTNKIEQSSMSWYVVNNRTANGYITIDLHVYCLGHQERFMPRRYPPGRCPDFNPNIQVTYSNGVNHIRFDQPYPVGHVAAGCKLPNDSSEVDVTLYQHAINGDTTYYFQRYLDRDIYGSYGTEVVTMTPDEKKVKDIRVASYPGNKMMYHIAIRGRTPGRYDGYYPWKSDYVSVVASSCPEEQQNCDDKGGPLGIAVSFALGLMGLIICIAGHKLIHLEMFCFGSFAIGLISYIALEKFVDLQGVDTLGVSLACGVAGGVLWAVLYHCKPKLPVFVLLPGLCFSFLLASCIVNTTPLVNDEWYRWLGNHVTYILVPFVCVALPKPMSILCSSVVGGYLVVCVADMFTGGVIRQIVLLSVNSAIYEDFWTVIVVLPWRSQDHILLAVWGVLIFVGILSQALMTKKVRCCRHECCSSCHPTERLTAITRGLTRKCTSTNISIRADDVGTDVTPADERPETASDTAPLLA